MNPKPVMRRCVSCRQLFDRQQLWRVVRQASGGIALDQGMGRSAYLCPTDDCLEDARRRKRLQRALRCQVADSVLNDLQSRLAGNGDASSEAR